MKNLNTTIGQALSTATNSNNDPFAQVRAEELTSNQLGAIKYFYARLERIYNSEYRRQLPDETTERASKAEFGKMIMDIKKDVMDKGLESLKEEISKLDSEYRWMKLPIIIDFVKHGGNIGGCRSGIYKPFERSKAITDQNTLLKQKKAGAEALDTMKGLFDD